MTDFLSHPAQAKPVKLSGNNFEWLTDLPGWSQPVRLDLQTSASRTELRPSDQNHFGGRPFHGHVTAFTKQGANGGFARYQQSIEP
ncbi:MAG: hypothetical protein LBE62_07065 [Azonexus sp.]|jgi:type VI secretion system secreted protein VgrG|nr:hypothetical protein [Azonexus sp.]